MGKSARSLIREARCEKINFARANIPSQHLRSVNGFMVLMNISFIVFLVCSAILVLLVIFSIRMFLAGRRYLAYVRRYSDQAYDFFVADNERWEVFEVASIDLIVDQLPKPSVLPMGMLFGPFQFRVPKRQNRVVTVCGKSVDCPAYFDQFVAKMTTSFEKP